MSSSSWGEEIFWVMLDYFQRDRQEADCTDQWVVMHITAAWVLQSHALSSWTLLFLAWPQSKGEANFPKPQSSCYKTAETFAYLHYPQRTDSILHEVPIPQ